jgi:hypothetical protein
MGDCGRRILRQQLSARARGKIIMATPSAPNVYPTTSVAPEAAIKDAAVAYVYLYPLVTFGVSSEV